METIQMINKPRPILKRMEMLAIEIRDLINKFQEKEDNYNDREVITSILKVAASYIINYRHEEIEKCEDIKESPYVDILYNYMKMASEGVENYWGDENEH